MRSTIVVAASIGVGLSTFIGMRLAGSLEQARTLSISLPPNALRTAHEVPETDVTAPTRVELAIEDFGATAPDTERPDAEILRWLAADPEFQRAVDELERDPDPEVRREAAQFLSELGVD